MRPIETLLIVANLLTFFVLVIPFTCTTARIRCVPLLPLLTTGVQSLVEGPRWQMFPAYILAGLFFLIWLLQNIAPVGLLPERSLIKRLITGLLVGLGILGMLVSIVLPIVIPIFRFPRPSGTSYAIGTLTYHWVDPGRAEAFTTDPDDHRELMMQIWYPAQPDHTVSDARYVPDADVISPALARLFNLPGFTFRHLKYITTHAIPSAPVVELVKQYPEVLLETRLPDSSFKLPIAARELQSAPYR